MHYQHGDQTHAIELSPLDGDRYRVTIDGETQVIQAQRLPDGAWLLKVDGQQVLAYSAAQGNERFVHVDGQTFTLTVPDARSQRRRTSRAAGDLTAQMPGQVREVLVSEGDAVETGQTLLILEAMKMEIRVSAPGAGTIKQVLVKTGDVVERGQRLVEIEA